MSHFAKVENGIVTQVLVVEPDFVATGALGDPGSWIQTSYNTINNQHTQGGEPLRGNYAGIGYTYDAENVVFIPPKPYQSWMLQRATWSWVPPMPAPADGKPYTWNEETKSWDQVVTE